MFDIKKHKFISGSDFEQMCKHINSKNEHIFTIRSCTSGNGHHCGYAISILGAHMYYDEYETFTHTEYR